MCGGAGGVDFSVSNHTPSGVAALLGCPDGGLCECEDGTWTFALDFFFGSTYEMAMFDWEKEKRWVLGLHIF